VPSRAGMARWPNTKTVWPPSALPESRLLAPLPSKRWALGEVSLHSCVYVEESGMRPASLQSSQGVLTMRWEQFTNVVTVQCLRADARWWLSSVVHYRSPRGQKEENNHSPSGFISRVQATQKVLVGKNLRSSGHEGSFAAAVSDGVDWEMRYTFLKADLEMPLKAVMRSLYEKEVIRKLHLWPLNEPYLV